MQLQRICALWQSAITVLDTIKTNPEEEGQADFALFSILPGPCLVPPTRAKLPCTNPKPVLRQHTGFLLTYFLHVEKELLILLSFQDEKELVVIPRFKLHLWKEITKQCISCAFL